MGSSNSSNLRKAAFRLKKNVFPIFLSFLILLRRIGRKGHVIIMITGYWKVIILTGGRGEGGRGELREAH